ncbi:ATP-dependent helicase [Corynebacterium sp. HMSC072G08]|uniref:ATP-dependent DNA helicase n=1 Tax=Corynebacterium sp. HMSC072G08 TaxID=1715039 RepID=UPI0008A2D6B9|nr:ATP-dependent DNA helicase [Corynebacterium sp. HMSC072G08]OFN42880.1 ATP-dependent helicase [Corynebacterium sp. HMSC072G08]
MEKSTEELLESAVAALGGARREGQVRMAKAVTKAFETQRHLAVQAGTGTGKSLAYLVPSLRHAQGAETSVIVSTATLALQRQLVHRDLPRLTEALAEEMDREPTFAIMKGRANYLCLNKLAQPESPEAMLDDGAGLDGGSWRERAAQRVTEWAQETETGDRDDLEPGVPDDVWKAFSVTSRECLGASRCPHGEDCFAELARREAADADVIVTNHALLAIDALSEANILPDHDAVVIDEAHELDDRITSVTTAEITARVISMAGNRVKALASDSGLTDLAEEFTIVTADCPEGRWTDMPEPVSQHLTGMEDTLRRMREKIARAPEGEQKDDPEKFAERQNLTNHLSDLAEAVARMRAVFAQGNPAEHEDVVWLSRRNGEGPATLAVAPLSVADLLRSNLFGEQTVVLTSATLALGGRFDVMATQWGLPTGTWDSLDAGTPFDPAKSGILYTAAHLPQPGRDGLSPETLAEIYELIMAAGGRTLGLFSSRRAANQAADALRARLPFDLYVQGDDTIGALVDTFAKNENSCLFGTLTLWQGVDVPGPACSLVLIDRIPFPRPDDPLMQARVDAAKAAGRNGFMEVSATHAALLMAQGAGRLLRHVGDRGVVAVLDPRLETKRYGGFLKASMPRFWQTTNPETVRGALKRLVQQL